MKRFCAIINNLFYLTVHFSIIRTIYLNLKFLPLRIAIRMPILVGRNTHFRSIKGDIILDTIHVKPGMIKIGFCQIFRDDYRSGSVLDINGELVFKGKAIFHTGCVLSLDKGSKMIIGDNFKVGADSVLHVRKSISFGDNVNISWNFQIIDTDFHYIKKLDTGDVYNNTASIKIGNNVWIGNHVSIGKGVMLPEGTIVSAKSHVNKSIETENTIIGGIPAKPIKVGYNRIFSITEETQLDKHFGNN